ncbi:MAG: DUF397 domain-containing protein [Actinomycetes bacterium]|nr:MAG: DUF397 domain-containing protein [Actinomycetota bacterium]
MTGPQPTTGNRHSTPSIQWRRSSHSGDTGNCVEVALLPSDRIGIRDSKNPAGPVLEVNGSDWRAFINWMRCE